MLDLIFERFVKQSPVSVMVRGLMERVFNKEQLDSIFENHARSQYTRELLFSSIVDLIDLLQKKSIAFLRKMRYHVTDTHS